MTTNRDRQDPSGADALDAALRAALEPDAATVDRLVRRALAEPAPRPVLRRWRWAAAALTLLATAVLLIPRLERPYRAPAATSRTAVAPPAATAEAITTAPAALRISNEHGPVTVTTPAGSKLVFLPRADVDGDDRAVPGGAS